LPPGTALVVETVSVEFAVLPDESASLEGSIDSWGPEGETEAIKLTVPLKPLEPASDMMELPVEPGSIAMYDGFAEIVKSGELNGPSRANSIVVGADTPFEYTMSIP